MGEEVVGAESLTLGFLFLWRWRRKVGLGVGEAEQQSSVLMACQNARDQRSAGDCGCGMKIWAVEGVARPLWPVMKAMAKLVPLKG